MKTPALLSIVVSLISALSLVAEDVSLPDHHLTVSLPTDWQRVSEARPGIVLSAQADGGRLRFMLTKPPVAVREDVHDAKFQTGVQQSLRDQGFAKIVRAEVVKVAGTDAYLCEAARDDRPHSILQVAWPYHGSFYSLVFLSLAKPIKDVPAFQRIIDSIKTTQQ